MLKQRANLLLSLALFGCCGLWKPSKQSHYSGYVLTCPGKVWESIIILDDPPLHVTDPVACGPAVLVTSDFPLKLRVF
jgi:hypothetical protein